MELLYLQPTPLGYIPENAPVQTNRLPGWAPLWCLETRASGHRPTNLTPPRPVQGVVTVDLTLGSPPPQLCCLRNLQM